MTVRGERGISDAGRMSQQLVDCQLGEARQERDVPQAADSYSSFVATTRLPRCREVWWKRVRSLSHPRLHTAALPVQAATIFSNVVRCSAMQSCGRLAMGLMWELTIPACRCASASVALMPRVPLDGGAASRKPAMCRRGGGPRLSATYELHETTGVGA